MKYQVEMTDTFGGEANYSWVKRAEFECEDNCSIVHKAKAALDIVGLKCYRDDSGDMITLRPSGLNQIIFITSVE